MLKKLFDAQEIMRKIAILLSDILARPS